MGVHVAMKLGIDEETNQNYGNQGNATPNVRSS
jgi:hypothetical protein